MRDITHKIQSLRTAIAQATIKAHPESIEKVKTQQIPKGDVFEIARTAGMMAVKKTHEAIPHCHPIPIDNTDISFETNTDTLTLKILVNSINRTGCEMEAMYGANVVATTIYDLLKPVDDQVEIQSIKLKEKHGGLSDYADQPSKDLTGAVLVASDSIAGGKKSDKAGQLIKDRLEKEGVAVAHYEIIPDEQPDIQQKIQSYYEEGIDLITSTGGTGLSPRDVTPEAIRPMLDVEIPGIMEAARSFGQERTPYAMLSRSLAGLKGSSIILALPGSSRGASETMDALFPYLLHLYRVIAGRRHG